jgi:hypothetical protein
VDFRNNQKVRLFLCPNNTTRVTYLLTLPPPPVKQILDLTI